MKPDSKSANTKCEKTEAKIKTVDDLYVDMTFFKPDIKHIPTREESVQTLIKFINGYLEDTDRQAPYYKLIYFKTSARIGYEYVYQTIYQKTGFRVHVNDLIYKIYDKLPQVQEALTRDPYETPIHCCIYENRKRDLAKTNLMCSSLTNSQAQLYNPINKELRVSSTQPMIPCVCVNSNDSNCVVSPKIESIKVILSAMWFTDTAGVDKILVEYKPAKNELNTPAYKYFRTVYRLCYSFHSSLSEIVDFVNTLQPRKLYSIALPDKTSSSNINDYFYDSSNRFVGFHLGSKQSERSNENRCKDVNIGKSKPEINQNKLLLRKRSSVEHFCNHGYSSDSDEHDQDDGLIFDDDEENLSVAKKIKKWKFHFFF